MKKITSLLMALVAGLFAISASAQTVTLPETYTEASALTDGYYVLKTRIKGDEGYIYHNPSGGARPFQQYLASASDLSLDATYVWKLTKTAGEDDSFTFTLQNVSSGAYIAAGGQGNISSTTNASSAANFSTDAFEAYDGSLTGGVLLAQTYSETSYHVFANTPNASSTTYKHNLSYWNGNNVGDNAATVQFAFYNVDNSFVEVTYNYKVGENTVITKTKAQMIGSSASAPSLAASEVSYYYTVGSITADDQTISSTNKSFDVPLTKGTAPFAEGSYYTVQFRAGTEYAGNLVYAGGSNIPSRSNITSWANYKGGTWQFVESGVGVKLYNVAYKKYVQQTESASNTAATMTESADDATAFIVRSNNNTTSDGTFDLQYPGTSYYIMGDHVNQTLGVWSVTSTGESAKIADAGSIMTITSITLDDAKTKYKSTFTAQENQYDDESNLLYVVASSAVSAANAEIDAKTSFDDLYAASIEASGAFTPETDAYYQIVGKRLGTDGHTKYILTTESMKTNTEGTLGTEYDSESNRQVLRNTTSDALVPQLWKFVSVTDGYHIQNANTGLSLAQMSSYGSAVDMPTNDAWAGTYTLELGQSSKYAMLCNNNHIINALNGENGNTIGDWNGNSSADDGSNWLIKKVTEVPVTINETAGYASVSFPFAVKLPTDDTDVKAYYGTMAGDGVLKLTEITDGIIPAKTGALLAKANGGTVKLTITTETGTAIEGNKLVGVTAKRAGYTSGDTYVLALNSNSEPAFLKSTLDVVPANKAYLPTSNITNAESSPSLSFTFGDTTGIKALNATTGATKYYDLNGRQVLYPTSGIYVTDGGQKVYIK